MTRVVAFMVANLRPAARSSDAYEMKGILCKWWRSLKRRLHERLQCSKAPPLPVGGLGGGSYGLSAAIEIHSCLSFSHHQPPRRPTMSTDKAEGWVGRGGMQGQEIIVVDFTHFTVCRVLVSLCFIAHKTTPHAHHAHNGKNEKEKSG